jgi:hypothetical protein
MKVIASLPELFLERLQRLADLRRTRASEFNAEGLAMIDRSIFSTFRECRDMGAESEALAILQATGLRQVSSV